jgi:5-methylcytosine-specific restriction endonuclease McrA
MSCPYLPKATLATKTKLNVVGKAGKRTAAAVAKWKRTQKPNHEGYFICYVCGKWIEYLEAEHVKSKARRPDLRTAADNLRPVCSNCNEAKGSKSN